MPNYAGIGSRKTPANILALMTRLAGALMADGWILRSGGAPGADEAFRAGCTNPLLHEIYLPGESFNGHTSDLTGFYAGPECRGWPEAQESVDKCHPNPAALNDFARALMARNALQVLGRDCRQPVGMVVCWTLGGQVAGGTGQALRIAADYNIPVRNLALPDVRAGVEVWLKQKAPAD